MTLLTTSQEMNRDIQGQEKLQNQEKGGEIRILLGIGKEMKTIIKAVEKTGPDLKKKLFKIIKRLETREEWICYK